MTDRLCCDDLTRAASVPFPVTQFDADLKQGRFYAPTALHGMPFAVLARFCGNVRRVGLRGLQVHELSGFRSEPFKSTTTIRLTCAR